VTPKERVIAAIKHEEPDRVPTGENQVDGALVEQILGRPVLYNVGWREIQAIWNGRRDEVVRDYCRVHVELPLALDWDYVRVPVVPASRKYKPPQMTGEHSWINEQGHEVHCNPDAGNIIVRSRFPDMSVDDLPDPEEPFKIDPSELEAIRYVVDELGDSHFIIARTPFDGTFPWQQTLGMESFLIKMITEPSFVEKATQLYVNRCIAYIRAMLDAGADAIMTTDDYSDNRGPIMGVDLFRKFVLPGIRRQCEAIHELGGYFIKHTDGNLWDVLGDLVNIGIDGWHGIQRNIGMDMGKLKQRHGERICLFGGVNTETLITGSTEDAREEVRSAIEQAGAGGGLVLTTSNVIPPGAKLENYRAMRQAVRDYGEYPIREHDRSVMY
jgi:uroporphyrinogen decarboxylase